MSATFRVCGKLRSSLLTLVGAVGYRSLISRSLTLARKGSPPLEKVQVKKDGSLECTGALDLELGMDEDTKGGVVLVAELLGLLITFIGQATPLIAETRALLRASLPTTIQMPLASTTSLPIFLRH